MNTMADAAELERLAERCEKATGPDRELDADIMIALDIRPAWLRDAEGKMWHDPKEALTIVGEPRVRWRDARMERSTGNPTVDKPLPYTSSLDAAMTLVPEGWHVAEMGEALDDNPNRNRRAYTGEWAVMLHSTQPGLLHNLKYGTATTPALALTAACLRARSTGDA